MSLIDPTVLWAPPAPRRLGRPAAYSREAIVAAAIAIADADGLPALSMRRVAGEIGAGTMSLYSHVPDKEHLIELMVDAVIAEATQIPPSGDPIDDLVHYARQQRALFLGHRWLTAALAVRQTLGPNGLTTLDNALALLAPVDLPPSSKMEAFALLTGFVSTYVGYELAQSEMGRSTAEAQAAQAAYLTGAATSGHYPHLTAAFAAMGAAAQAPPDPEETFERLARRILAGLLTPPEL
ncbi:AcrR family transcriptional regulator [Allocatelliglobosispora scoriae]|uniref:AcrR family transcriptional regulator n=1 Tax=Allocatelliglobosispora scoriae TaxID=643052 RepID=A0A841BME6_9ACTN|nr:TetR/AcrR family transcriptional regulator [Allocatelliglobosispora scoriae]MBB5867932.1 AcrR family transcriptional regulator [Allocatelliglobosispora scoriae]